MSAEPRPVRTVAHVLQWLYLGGAESVALQLATRQVRRGLRVHLLSLESAPGSLWAEFEAAGVTVHALARSRDGLDPLLWPRALSQLRRIAPDVVHTHDPKSLVYAAGPARLLGARVVHTKHGIDVAPGRERWLVRAAAEFAHVVAVVSEAAAVAARAGEAPAGRVVHVPNGVDLDKFAPEPRAREATRAELGLAPGDFAVGVVGRLEPVKGHDVLLRAVSALGAPYRAVLVGTGGAEPELRAMAPPGTVFTGARRDVARLLSALDVVALPSRSEGLPLALLEAMAAARPVVASAVGGMPAALGEAGVLVQAEDVDGLAAALRALAADPTRAAHLARSARARVAAHFSLDRAEARYLALYAADDPPTG